jgi:hypothetical protein
VKSNELIYSLEIVDVNFKLLKTIQISPNFETEIDLNEFSSGIYFVKTLIENQKMEIQKIVKN